MSHTVTPAPATVGPARLSAGTVRQYLAARSRLGDGTVHVLLLRAAPLWDGPVVQRTAGGLQARVAVAPSVLAVHEQILGHLDAAAPPDPKVLVVLTDCEDTDLDPGLLARVYGGRIRSVDNWEVVQEAFDARGLDGRLRRETWAAEALLDAAATRGWPSLGKGLLSRDEALTRLARRRLKLGRRDTDALGGPAAHDDGDRIDPVTLFRWTHIPGGPDLLRDLRGPERAGLARFLAEPEQAGSTGKIITALVDAEHGADAAAYAVVCAALWGHAEADHDLYRARGRAERWLGDQPPAQGDDLDRLLTSFGQNGEAYVRGLVDRGEHRLADPVLSRAAQLVTQFGAQAAATASPLLAAGLDARFTAAGHALAGGATETVTAAVTALAEHALALDGATQARIERVRMAARLGRWLANRPEVDIASVADGTARQIRELGWVDRALEHLEAGGDADHVLADAYSWIGAQVRDKRRELDRVFSERLAVWTADGTAPGAMLTVETFLDRVIAPIVACPGQRVLLLLVDGMSAAIAAELGEGLRGQWAEFDPLPDTTGAPVRRAVAAALPTLTAVSRTSLFAGTLMKGDQSDEKRLFPQHPCWNGAPAAVFHKDDLRGPDTGSPFSTALTEALADERTHVAVVLNTVDDRLAKEQKLGDGAWQTKEIGGLDPLLRAARANDMTVLLTSDHGHVIERRGNKIDAAGGTIGSARHRTPGGPVTPSEIELSGPRVVWPEPGSRIVALRDHDTRYTALKAGYHGGATLAEFTIPLLALLPFGTEPPTGWRELGDPAPSWWAQDAENRAEVETGADSSATLDATAARPSRKQTKKAAPPVTKGAISLFGEDEVASPAPQKPAAPAVEPVAVPASAPAEDPAAALVERLMATALYQEQLDLLARVPRDKTVLPKSLAALVEAGTLPMTALAERAGQAATRAPGLAATLAQLLNYDGAQILEILPDNRTLRLHRAQLIEQFGL
ncbi:MULTISPECIES: BREX-2 system phosphatase PglZ [unclassified Streptomyces]|uniref:BREX-2 system phosphatase PglZ n=1 Tax=unclassified Streptomyces TaxID=2593676 RepID=UPI000823882F|nr:MULTISPECIES: BREX-2 system phosphatase PglZ [unclassified Streptomyces]MYU02125.1 BREX-2 system phosphatase PglZ [Streptomyces sp. SID8350]SCK61622.1 PglZ domain-containing protein [Streptomyces sp. AmelKG-D3]